jgi:hypothetical protein
MGLRLRTFTALACLALVVQAGQGPARAETPLQAAIAKLTPEQQATLKAYQKARADHEKAVDRYWMRIEAKQKVRKLKALKGKPIVGADYVKEHPPEYKGPERPDAIYALLPKPPKPPVTEPKPVVPVVTDFLREAEAIYGFKPERIPEDDFMIAYAVEAVKLGLTKDQVVRVFALETGGMGTHDMQSGFNPKTGRAASTALGYAQLLGANTIEQIRKEGDDFIARLEEQAAQRGTSSSRAERLKQKVASLRKMQADARRVPESWSAHVAYAKTPKGMAMHAINLDGDIGPWLQVTKLKSVKEYAAKRGMTQLTGGQLEMMNLAGPGRGFEMMTPVGRDMPTANFFERGGYERNPVTANRTGAQLLARLDEIMDKNVQRPGSIRFAEIFDAISKKRPEVLNRAREESSVWTDNPLTAIIDRLKP